LNLIQFLKLESEIDALTYQSFSFLGGDSYAKLGCLSCTYQDVFISIFIYFLTYSWIRQLIRARTIITYVNSVRFMPVPIKSLAFKAGLGKTTFLIHIFYFVFS